MAALKNNTAQLEFIQRIKQMVPANHSLVDEVADLLQLSNDSAYRRIRGETALSIDEVVLLCNHYKISFDSFNNQHSGTVTFNCKSLGNNDNSLEEYLTGILNDLKKIQGFDKKEIVYAAEDIPIFHNFKFPELTAFKLFYWNKSVINPPSLSGKKFNFDSISKEFIELSKNIYDTYSAIPSIEIWTEETISSLLKQIEFYWTSGLFERKEDALVVCDQVTQMVSMIEKQAEMGSKNKNAACENNFTLYNSEIMIGNNTILVNMGAVKVTYISYHFFNSMITTNNSFCNETDSWLKNLIKKSTLISGVGEKQRYQFFKKKYEAVKKLRESIENY